MARRRAEPPLDPFERAARRSDPEYARLVETEAPPRSIRAPRLLLLFAVLVLAAALVRGGHGSPSLKRSCTTPAFALDRTTIDVDSTVTWTATGPPADRVLVGLDTPETLPDDPVGGPLPLTGCLAHGVFPMQARTGEHTLTLFVVTDGGQVVRRLSKAVTVR